MQIVNGRFVYAASDLNNYLECAHLTELERRVALGELVRPAKDETVELIARKGDEHERRHLERLRAQDAGGLVAFEDRAENTPAGLRAAEARTVAAMENGAPLIYQATLFDGRFLGHADFLRRVDKRCGRWPWSYEVIDTKLALSPKPYFLIQLCNYSEHLARVQGSDPQYAHIVLGSGVERRFRVEDYAAYYRHVKSSFLSDLETIAVTYPYDCSHCAVCVWNEACERRRDRDDHLSLVAFIRHDQIAKLEGAGITTLGALATATADRRPRGMSEVTFANLRAQARQQHKQRRAIADGGAGEPYCYEFRPASELSGFAKLPKPAAGDVFFDIEGDPLYRPDRGLEYLWGAYLPDEAEYACFWATDPAEERAAFERFVDFVVARLARYPDLHVYHYAPYETTALKRLMGRFVSREKEIDDFLRRGIFVDLLPVVRQGLWISQPSYSLKKVEAFYGMERATQTKGGDESIVMFESWRESREDALLEDIRRYNEDDCRSTYRLREWLIERRAELNARLPAEIPWRSAPEPPPANDDTERSELERALLNGLPEPDSLSELRSAAETLRARWLLGHLVQYHRRESKPEWWKYFERCKNPEDLEEHDREALGGLRLRTDIKSYRLRERDKNLVYTYEFPPQDHHLGTDRPLSPYTGKGAGSVVVLDDAARTLGIKLSAHIEAKHLRALIPGTPLPTKDKQRAVAAIAEAYLSDELERHHPATLQLLLARMPRLRDRPLGARIQPADVTKEAVSHTIRSLSESYLFVQGPPGSGKTVAGAWAIVDLLRTGKRVGLLANNHKALHNLLREIEATAAARRVTFLGRHKSSQQTEGSAYGSRLSRPMVENVAVAGALASEACQLASGTAFAWADPALVGRFDYLFIEEAGQVSLADALIASMGARNVVLLGDPLQLPQVSQGSHPVGTELSILEHLLGDAATIPEDRGVFLERSYRMHPRVGAFISRTIYEGRLRSDGSTAANRVESAGLSGSGLVYLPVEHTGNSRHSIEEAERVVCEVGLLLHGEVVVRDEPPRRLRQSDILVVTPYNLQRLKIGELLKAAGYGEIPVGTVDKFQGQQAPIVLYSMATSSGEDLPRDMEFLFNKNRFNVAISRAQCLSVLVCSPHLLDTRCRTPEQMVLVNLLCAFAEATADSRLPTMGAARETPG